MKNSNHKTYYRRHLPHIHPTHAQYFVTFRLTNSLPKSIVEKLQMEYRELISKPKLLDAQAKFEQYQMYFNKFDQLLDSSHSGSLWLQLPEVAKYVSEALHYHNGASYDLIAHTIMPNHVHLLFNHSVIGSKIPVNVILQSVKKYSARKANKILIRTGKSFWQSESYDHVVRNDEESENVIRYILYNPVKAGFCKEWHEWKWTYLKEEYRGFFK